MEPSDVVRIAGAGIAGTTAMTLVMGLIHGFGWANADMVRAIGTLYTRKEDNAFSVGLSVHYGAGILFAFLYAVALYFAPIQSPTAFSTVLVCILISFFHGLVVSMLLAIEVAEHHPLEKFRKAGAGVVFSHLIGHIFYGLFVGLFLALTAIQLPGR